MWQVETTSGFDKVIARLDKPLQRRIVASLESLESIDDPRSRGKGLTGQLVGYWRYRIGDYRVIADIQDHRLVIIAITIAHRSEAYD